MTWVDKLRDALLGTKGKAIETLTPEFEMHTASEGVPGLSISIRVGASRPPPVPHASSQTKPKDFYVYVHLDPRGEPFYVGKGIDRRAWSLDRDDNWKRLVNEVYHGQYTVRVLNDGLTEEEAYDLEDQYMHVYGDKLVNRQSGGRSYIPGSLQEQHGLWEQRDRALGKAALAKTPQERLQFLKEAMSLDERAARVVVGVSLFDRMEQANGPYGNNALLEELTYAYLDCGDSDGAETAIQEFLRDRPRYADGSVIERVRKRIARVRSGKSLVKRKTLPTFVLPSTLPEGWEWDPELSERVPRLDRKLYKGKVLKLDIKRVPELVEQGKLQEALTIRYNEVVQEEKRCEKPDAQGSRWTCTYSEFHNAAKVAQAIGRPMEACLMYYRGIHFPGMQPRYVAGLVKMLGEATLVLNRG